MKGIRKLIEKYCTRNEARVKGYELYQNDSIDAIFAINTGMDDILSIGMEVTENFDEDYGEETYGQDMIISFDESYKNFDIKEYTCECDEFKQEEGLCRHIVAGLLKLEDAATKDMFEYICTELEEDDEYDIYEKYEIGNQFFGADGFIKSMMSRTFYDGTTVNISSSEELLTAMSEITLKERNKFCKEQTNGIIEIKPTLHIKKDKEYLDFKVGSRQLYVVKNVDDFIDSIKQQKYVKYGKNLGFVHTQSAFSKEALSLVEFLMNIDLENIRKNNYSYYSYYGALTKRDVILGRSMTDQFMEMYEGKTVNADIFLHNDILEIPIVREDPKLPISIKRYEEDNYAMMLFPKYVMLEGVKTIYIYYSKKIYICSEDYTENMKSILSLAAKNILRTQRDNYYWKGTQDIYISEQDYSQFCATMLPILKEYTKLKCENIDFSKYESLEGEYKIQLDIDGKDNILCYAEASYNENKHNLIDIATVDESYRDIKVEYELRTLINQYFKETTNDGKSFLMPTGDDDRLASFIEHGVQQLQDIADVMVSERFKKIRIAKGVRLTTGVSLKTNLFDVKWNIEGMSNDELIDILAAYKKKKKYFKLKDGELLNIEDSGIGVMAQLEEGLHLSKAQLREGKAQIPLYRAMYFDMLMKENADRISVSRDEMFKNFIDNFDEVSNKKYEIPEGIKADLRGYQKEGYRWANALSELGFGGILADDMGLGKTLQMITYMTANKKGTNLVVCPTSLVYNWEDEVNKFAPDMKVCTLAGQAAERIEQLENYRDYDVMVTSYDTLRRDIDNYTDKKFECQIIDEAQYIKNPATLSSKAVKSINSNVRFALTGTPIENRLSELWSIFEYLMPGYLFSYKYFKDTFEENIINTAETDNNTALSRLQKMISPFILRRAKGDVLKELPEKVEETVYIKMGDEQDNLYKASEKNLIMSLREKSGEDVNKDKLRILAEITKLRQICCDPSILYDNYKEGSAKLEACMEIVKNAIEGGHRILIFSQFTSMLDRIANVLEKENIIYFLLKGDTTKVKRKKLVDEFQAGHADVFLISLKAGGTGLNLTAADTVIHFDPWWNVAAQNQATDRSHRIGQKNNVTVIKLIAKNTIEERIVKLQEKKKDLADKIISAEGVSLSSMSKDDILELFK